MPEFHYNGKIKTINLKNCIDYDELIKICRNKFRSKFISVLRVNKKDLNKDNLVDIVNSSVIYCYDNNNYDSEKEITVLKKKYCDKIDKTFRSFVSFNSQKKVEYLQTLNGIIRIEMFPNIYDADIFPKGTMIVSDRLFPSYSLVMGKGTTVFGIKNIVPKLKKLRSLDLSLSSCHVEIHEVIESDNNFNYLMIVRSEPTEESSAVYDESFKRDSSTIKYGCDIREADFIISKQHEITERWSSKRKCIADKVAEKLNIDSIELITDQIECQIVKIEDRYYNMIDTTGETTVFITGSRESPSYLVRSRTDYLPCCAGRRFSRFKTAEIAKNHLGEIIGSLKNRFLICDYNNYEFIYEEYYRGYKNIDKIIDDLKNKNMLETVMKTEPLVIYKK